MEQEPRRRRRSAPVDHYASSEPPASPGQENNPVYDPVYDPDPVYESVPVDEPDPIQEQDPQPTRAYEVPNTEPRRSFLHYTGSRQPSEPVQPTSSAEPLYVPQ